MDQPTVTAAKIIDALRTEGIVDDQRLIELLGADRHDVSLNRLEMAVTEAGLISDGRLAMLKGMVAGRKAVANEDEVEISDALEAKLAKRFGILLVDRAPTTVLMVEDLPVNVEAARRALNTDVFEIWLITAGQFASLWGQVYREKVRRNRQSTVAELFAVLDTAVGDGASDIHLVAGQPPWLRVDGKVRPMRVAPLEHDWLCGQIAQLVGPDVVKAALAPPYRVDTAYTYGSSRFRINLGRARQGITMVARKLPTQIPSCDDLGLPQAIRRFVTLERGLVLVTGPTGSGKSTTLAALLAEVLKSPRTLITLEDPVEFRFESNPDGGLVYQRELDTDFATFSEALKSALRQDPDVILVGEMRDLETMRTAITAAETGHLVFGTLHTSSAEGTVGRLINQFPEGEQNQVRTQLTSILKGVVSQSLVPRKSGRGRVGAYEVMVQTPAVANNLRTVEGMKHLRNTLATGSADGMQTMEMALVELVMRGVVNDDHARFRARDVKDFDQRLAEARGGGTSALQY